MAQPVTDDELQLRKRARRRLVGAIVLVLLVVVFLPMALDNQPKPLSKNVDIQVPALDSAESKFPSVAPPPAPQPVTPQTPAVEPKSAEVLPTAPPAPVTAAPEPVKPALPEAGPKVGPEKKVEPEGKPGSARKVEAAKPPAPVKEAKREPPKAVAPLESQGYVIQLGAFSNVANAKQLHQRIRAAKIPAYLEPMKAADGEKTRVRAGPFSTEEAADTARQKLLKLALSKGDLKIVKQGE